MIILEEVELAYKINELIKKHKEYIKLKKIEDKMNKDNNLQVLLASYQDAQKAYNKAIEDKQDKKEAQKRLADIKFKVDTNKIVIKYNKQYKKVNALLEQLKSNILEGINI